MSTQSAVEVFWAFQIIPRLNDVSQLAMRYF